MASPSVYELSSRNGSDSVLTAANGTYVLNDTSTYSGNFRAIVVLQDTVFNFIKINGVDQKSSYISTPATAVKAGAIITPLSQQMFDSIKLTSGSVSLVI